MLGGKTINIANAPPLQSLDTTYIKQTEQNSGQDVAPLSQEEIELALDHQAVDRYNQQYQQANYPDYEGNEMPQTSDGAISQSPSYSGEVSKNNQSAGPKNKASQAVKAAMTTHKSNTQDSPLPSVKSDQMLDKQKDTQRDLDLKSPPDENNGKVRDLKPTEYYYYYFYEEPVEVTKIASPKNIHLKQNSAVEKELAQLVPSGEEVNKYQKEWPAFATDVEFQRQGLSGREDDSSTRFAEKESSTADEQGKMVPGKENLTVKQEKNIYDVKSNYHGLKDSEEELRSLVTRSAKN